MQFVDFSMEQGPLLVMEYLPLGSLARQRGITEEETLGILCQGLQALEYLHSQRLAHRDIKPGNILLQSRTPFLIKLVDFGLAKNDSILETFCGSNAYAAPEVWEGRSYTTAVDIWSLGVIVLQYAYGLPKPTRKRKGSQWCRDIVKAAKDGEDGDTLIDIISTKMLTMNDQNRLSASDCLEQAYRLGFHNVHTFETGYATPTGRSTRQHDITRRTGSRSIVMQPLQKKSPDGDVSSGFYYVGGSSESTEIAPSKRDLRGGIQSYNRTSQRSLQHAQGATQIRNPQPEGISKSTLSKRRRPQTTQSPTADAVGRGQAKRSRALVSCEAGAQLSKASNPRQGPEQLERSISSNHEGPLSPKHTARTSRIGNLRPQLRITASQTGREMIRTQAVSPESNEEVLEAMDDIYVRMKVEDQIVLLRKEDCFLNATQIMNTAKLTKSTKDHLFHRMKMYTNVEANAPRDGRWVNLQHSRILCKHLNLEQRLRPLLDYAQNSQTNGVEMAIGEDQDYLAENHVDPKYIAVPAHPKPVLVQKLDFRVNASQLLRVIGGKYDTKKIWRAVGGGKYDATKIARDHSTAFNIVHRDTRYRGIYVDFDIAIDLCRKHGLVELESQFRQVRLEEQSLRTMLPSEGLGLEVQPSDATGQMRELMRPDSGLPQEWRDSHGTESRSQPDNPDPEDDIREEDPGEEYLTSDEAASESSTNSSETSTERESEPSSVRLGAKAAPLHQRTPYSLAKTDPQSPPAKSSHYPSWASQSQHSRLSLFKPDLKQPSRTASPYESFTNFC